MAEISTGMFILAGGVSFLGGSLLTFLSLPLIIKAFRFIIFGKSRGRIGGISMDYEPGEREPPRKLRASSPPQEAPRESPQAQRRALEMDNSLAEDTYNLGAMLYNSLPELSPFMDAEEHGRLLKAAEEVKKIGYNLLHATTADGKEMSPRYATVAARKAAGYVREALGAHSPRSEPIASILSAAGDLERYANEVEHTSDNDRMIMRYREREMHATHDRYAERDRRERNEERDREYQNRRRRERIAGERDRYGRRF